MSTLPYSLDAEQNVIGSVMIDPRKLDDVLALIGPCDLFDERTGTIFAAIVAMQKAGEPLDSSLLLERLRSTEQLDAAGGDGYLIEVVSCVPAAAHAEHYAKIIARKAQQRRMILAGQQLIRLGGDDQQATARPDDWRDAAQQALDDALASQATRAVGTVAVVRCLADMQSESVRWLWPERIALGKLTMLVGNPGLGKSFATIDLAARVSQGTAWPDDPRYGAPQGGVVMLNCEDDLADTIRPRLDKAGADVSRIYALTAVKTSNDNERHFDLSRDLPALEQTVAGVTDCRLVVIDPVTAYLGETDSHKNAETRAVLAQLSQFAARHRVAVVCVSHLNKSNSGPVIYRTMGSLAFVAAARSVWAVCKDEQQSERRLFLPVKNNIGIDTLGMAYSIIDGRVVWETEPVSISADEAMGPVDERKRGGGDAVSEAKTWLADQLAEQPVPSNELKQRAERDGLSWRTVERAKTALGIENAPVGFGKPWAWRLPDRSSVRQSAPVFPESAKPKTLADSAKSGGDWSSDSQEWGEIR